MRFILNKNNESRLWRMFLCDFFLAGRLKTRFTLVLILVLNDTSPNRNSSKFHIISYHLTLVTFTFIRNNPSTSNKTEQSFRIFHTPREVKRQILFYCIHLNSLSSIKNNRPLNIWNRADMFRISSEIWNKAI